MPLTKRCVVNLKLETWNLKPETWNLKLETWNERSDPLSAAYEWIEWFVSIATGDGGDAFLGTQGYVWDTQSDMLFATIGAITMLITLSKTQNKALEKV
jgi:hypothetical protein